MASAATRVPVRAEAKSRPESVRSRAEEEEAAGEPDRVEGSASFGVRFNGGAVTEERARRRGLGTREGIRRVAT